MFNTMKVVPLNRPFLFWSPCLEGIPYVSSVAAVLCTFKVKRIVLTANVLTQRKR